MSNYFIYFLPLFFPPIDPAHRVRCCNSCFYHTNSRTSFCYLLWYFVGGEYKTRNKRDNILYTATDFEATFIAHTNEEKCRNICISCKTPHGFIYEIPFLPFSYKLDNTSSIWTIQLISSNFNRLQEWNTKSAQSF